MTTKTLSPPRVSVHEPQGRNAGGVAGRPRGAAVPREGAQPPRRRARRERRELPWARVETECPFDTTNAFIREGDYVWLKWHDAYDAEPSQEHLEQTARAPDAR